MPRHQKPARMVLEVLHLSAYGNPVHVDIGDGHENRNLQHLAAQILGLPHVLRDDHAAVAGGEDQVGIVSRPGIEQIVADAAYAPSWKNTQIARYVLVEDRTTIDKMAEEMVLDFKLNEKTLKNCPAVMVLTYVTGRSGYERDGSFSTPKEAGFEMFDAGVAAQTFCLAAWERGVGTVITGYFDEEKITRLLNLPENQKVGCVIGLGYPDEEPAAPKRKSVEDLLTYK